MKPDKSQDNSEWDKLWDNHYMSILSRKTFIRIADRTPWISDTIWYKPWTWGKGHWGQPIATFQDIATGVTVVLDD